jgi:RNA polymerase sigma-70 factor (ECF subfamily)
MTAARERRLLEGAARGDRQALRSLYEEYSVNLFAAAYRVTESSADARDVLHDVFSELPEMIRGFDHKLPLGPWLRSVTAHAALKHLRSEQRRHDLAIGAAPDEPEVIASPESSVLDSIAVERALSSLPDELRAVVALKEMEGYSHRETAEFLQIARSTSEGRLYKARKLLRATLFER